MATRAKNLKLVKFLYSEVGFSEDQVKFLENKGLRSASAITEAYNFDDSLAEYEEKNIFPCGEVSVLRKLAKYLKWTMDTVGNYSALEENFNGDAFDTFQPDRVLDTSKVKNVVHNTTSPTAKALTVRIADYPKFNGKSIDWPKYY